MDKFQTNNLERLHEDIADYQDVVDHRDGVEGAVSVGFGAQVGG